MTGSPSSVERAYQRLKTDLLTGALGLRVLDLRALSDRLKMSVTPVREALARLNAERLVRLAPHQGYVVTIPSQRRIEHLYELSGTLLDFCLDRTSRLHRGPSLQYDAGHLETYAESMCALVEAIATAQNNDELADQILGLNDRLFAVRRCEPKLFPDSIEELERLSRLWNHRDYPSLRLSLRQHHHARLLHAKELADMMARGADAA